MEKIIDLDERRFALGAEHRVGRAYCRSCGADENVSDMVSGLCPACAYVRTKALADMQRQYATAVDAGEPDAAARVAEIITAYEQKERVQLRGAFYLAGVWLERGMNSRLSFIPMPAASRLRVRRDGFPVPFSSRLMSA